MTQFFHLLFELCLRYSHFYLKNVKIHLHGVPLGPFWSAKYLNFGGESCEIRILPCSVQETYTSRKVKKTGFTFSIELRSRFDSSHGLLPFVGGYYEDFLYLLVCKVQSSMSMSFATAVTFFSQAKSIAALPI